MRQVAKSIEKVELSKVSLCSLFEFRMEIEHDEEFAGLMESIRRHGVIEPIIIRPTNPNRCHKDSQYPYELVSGYRRYVACERLGITRVPSIIMEVGDKEAFEIALIENIQRKRLDPIEEAEAMKSYVMSFGRGSVTKLARNIGKSEVYVSHRLLLLGLPKVLKERISSRLLNPTLATELLWVRSTDKQVQLGEAIERHRLTLRQVRAATRLLKVTNMDVEDVVQKILQAEVSLSQDVQVAPRADAVRMDDPWLATSGRSESRDSEIATVKRAELIMRTAVAGLELLIERSSQAGDAYALLLQERQSLSQALDDVIKAKVAIRKKEIAQSYGGLRQTVLARDH